MGEMGPCRLPAQSGTVKIIILGAGQVGRTAAYHLAREEANEVTVVDTNDELLRDLQDRLDIRTVAGNASHPARARAGRRRRRRHARRADQQRRSEHDRLPDRLHAVPHAAPRSRASARARRTLLAHRHAVRRRRGFAVDVCDQPRAAGHRVHRAADPLSRRAAGAGLRRRPRAPGRHAGASRAACWSASSCARCASTSRTSTRASPPSTATGGSIDARRRHGRRGRRRGVLPRRHATTSRT